VTLPLMSVVQFLCAKIGMVSGMGFGRCAEELLLSLEAKHFYR